MARPMAFTRRWFAKDVVAAKLLIPYAEAFRLVDRKLGFDAVDGKPFDMKQPRYLMRRRGLFYMVAAANVETALQRNAQPVCHFAKNYALHVFLRALLDHDEISAPSLLASSSVRKNKRRSLKCVRRRHRLAVA